MARSLTCAALLLAVALPVTAADDAYTIKLYKDKEGDVTKKTTVKKTEGTVSFAVGDMKGNEKQKGKEEVVYTEEILKWPADAKRATKFSRTYEKVDKTSDRGEEVKSFLAGKTVVVDRSKDKPAFTVDGKPPTDDQQKELDAEFGEEKSDFDKHDMLPGKPVKVGDTWTLDKKKVLAALGEKTKFGFDEEKSSFTGKLVKAAMKDGALHGTIEFNLKFALTDFPLGPNMAAATEAGSVMTIKASIDCCLDGTVAGEKSDITMTMLVKAKLPMDGKLEIDSTVSGTETEVPVKKK